MPVPRNSQRGSRRLRRGLARERGVASLLMQGVRDASVLTCYGGGSHFLILRENPETLEVVEILQERMNLEEHLERLAKEGRQSRSCP